MFSIIHKTLTKVEVLERAGSSILEGSDAIMPYVYAEFFSKEISNSLHIPAYLLT